jgi:hypothetical protein
VKLTNQRENSISVGCGRRWAGVVATLLALAVLLGCAAVPISGQTAGEGTIEGTVKDGSGAIVPGQLSRPRMSAQELPHRAPLHPKAFM